MSIPKVSVTIVAYNAEKYIGQAIKSILAQTYRDFELLIVDDGSTDKSLQIIESYHDFRIRVVGNSTNRGVSHSRNKALRLARGEYVAVLDADDVALRDRLQVEVEYLDANPDIQLVGSAYQVIDGNGYVERMVVTPTDSLTNEWKLVFGNCLAHSTVMFRRDAVLAVGGYDERLARCVDFDLYSRLSPHGDIAQIDRPLAQWRRHGQGLWQGAPDDVRNRLVTQTVIRSIELRTGQVVAPELGDCLRSNGSMAAVDYNTVVHSLSVIEGLLEHFMCLVPRAAQRKALTTLAMGDIFRVARRNNWTYFAALGAAIRIASVRDVCEFLAKKVMKRLSMVSRHR